MCTVFMFEGNKVMWLRMWAGFSALLCHLLARVGCWIPHGEDLPCRAVLTPKVTQAKGWMSWLWLRETHQMVVIAVYREDKSSSLPFRKKSCHIYKQLYSGLSVRCGLNYLIGQIREYYLEAFKHTLGGKQPHKNSENLFMASSERVSHHASV